MQDSLFDSKSLEYRPNFAGRDIGELYKILFENDLNSTKQRTLEQLDTLREKSENQTKEYELCKLENAQLKSFIKRYKKLINEKEHGHDHDHGPHSRHDTMMDKASSQSPHEIDR